MNLLHPVLIYGRMIKFSHSVFALPFALSGAALAATVDGITLPQVGWIILAMVAARSAAMGFNRIADRDIDAANPRTRNRELPRGIVSPFAAGLFVFLSAGLLVWASAQLNPLCLYLSPVAIAIIFLYSYTKRFTWLSHLVLGSCLGLAPLGAWIAVTGRFDLPPVILGLSVLSWVAGFDILYSCQDEAFDVKSGLYSIPVRFGLKRSLHIARGLHTLAVLLMALLGHFMHMDVVYFAGVIFISALLAYEHALVKPDDLTKVNMAFMTMNSIVSIAYFTFTLADLLFLRGDGEAFSWVRTTFATAG